MATRSVPPDDALFVASAFEPTIWMDSSSSDFLQVKCLGSKQELAADEKANQWKSAAYGRN